VPEAARNAQTGDAASCLSTKWARPVKSGEIGYTFWEPESELFRNLLEPPEAVIQLVLLAFPCWYAGVY
jgi:hypothetical protein